MKIRLHPNSDGIALIVALIAVLVLSALAAGFALSMKVETRLAYNANSETQMYWLGRSGVEYCRWVLAQEKCPYDSLNQIWAGGSGSECDTNLEAANPVQIGGGTCTWQIIDLERYANINTANGLEIQQALTDMGVDANESSVVADSIQDWIGPPGTPRVAGAESDYYQGLDPAYYAKNAPVDDMSELLLVRGILDHREIYWGGCATNRPGPTFHHKLGFGNSPGENPCYTFGLKDVFTAISSGHININTAGTNVLAMIPGMNAVTADNIIKLRAGPDGVDGTEDDTPFQNQGAASAAIQSAGGNPNLSGNFVATRSSTFEVHISAQIGSAPPRNYTAILYRNSGSDIRVLSFY
jgi:general secretion pathway protein K